MPRRSGFRKNLARKKDVLRPQEAVQPGENVVDRAVGDKPHQ